VHGRRVPITEMTEKIDQVDNKTIRRVAARIFGPSSGAKPTVVCMGHEDTGSYDEIFQRYGLAASN
jgi:processing peptidase subunit alpha